MLKRVVVAALGATVMLGAPVSAEAQVFECGTGVSAANCTQTLTLTVAEFVRLQIDNPVSTLVAPTFVNVTDVETADLDAGTSKVITANVATLKVAGNKIPSVTATAAWTLPSGVTADPAMQWRETGGTLGALTSAFTFARGGFSVPANSKAFDLEVEWDLAAHLPGDYTVVLTYTVAGT